MSEPASGEAASGQVRSYKLVSAKYRDKAYEDGIMTFDAATREIELKQLAGKRKKEDVIVARFRADPEAEVRMEGPTLKVSELLITLESAALAGELAGMLARNTKVREETMLLPEAESSLEGFLEIREEAMTLLSKLRVDPRAAVLSADPTFAFDATKDPLEAIYAGYSVRLGESLQKMNSFFADAEKHLGPRLVERLYALGYTIGQVQNAVFDPESDLTVEVTALRELGVVVTPQELRVEGLVGELIVRAHPFLEALAPAKAPESG